MLLLFIVDDGIVVDGIGDSIEMMKLSSDEVMMLLLVLILKPPIIIVLLMTIIDIDQSKFIQPKLLTWMSDDMMTGDDNQALTDIIRRNSSIVTSKCSQSVCDE